MGGKLKTALAVWITGVWTVTVVAGVFTGDLLPAQVVSPVMLLATGYWAGTEIVDRVRRRGND